MNIHFYHEEKKLGMMSKRGKNNNKKRNSNMENYKFPWLLGDN